MLRYLCTLILLAWSGLCLAAPVLSPVEGPVEIKKVRVWPAPDNTRLVFDVSAPVQHQLNTFPDRIEVDVRNAALLSLLPAVDAKKSFFTDIRSMTVDDTVRIVIALKNHVRAKSFVLGPNQQYGHRLVIDFFPDENQEAVNETVAEVSKPTAVLPPPSALADQRAATTYRDVLVSRETGRRERPSKQSPARDLVIAIDAGHGGDDPGATGPGGTMEKDIVLSIARRLETLIRKEPGMRAVMIRGGDYYVSLRKRINKAREHKADLFISIHADAAEDSDAHGSSVYTLSERGATNEAARWLAERENAADLVGGVSLDDKDDLLASVLLDLSQTATSEASMKVAQHILDGLRQVGRVHRGGVEQAGFVVLKSPDIPSILVETAYISNPNEEKKLRNGRYQQALAEAILNGVRGYAIKHSAPGTRVAQVAHGVLPLTYREELMSRKAGRRERPATRVHPYTSEVAPAREHVVRNGETWSSIAKQYQVSAIQLRNANSDLPSRPLPAGKVLRVPPFVTANL
ncbi:MAG TPA: N-acetylmuramoyl-L-alanine amidase [Gammaproteobacteria bacterium]|nr:N-acetylmuramoyl-L-alanine amidase [Gammaproteobacteria bacterium]